MRKKENRFYKGIFKFIILMLLFLTLLLCHSAQWLLDTFGPISFMAVLYQLNSPLKGTGQGILQDYVLHCLVKSIVEIILFGIVWQMIASLRKRLIFRIEGRLFDKEINWYFNIRRWNFVRVITWMSIFLLSAVSLYRYTILVGIPEYLEIVSTASAIYEEEYIAPDSVQITFPKQKKNLLFIYLESMEATYASLEEGGGKPYNYIPNLARLAQENISFSDKEQLGGLISYDGSSWTMAALMASTAGIPYRLPIEGNTVGEYERVLPGAVTLGEVLQDAGYHNYFMCGSDAEFGGRKQYFEQHGDYEIIDYYTAIDDGLISEGYYEFWGFEDEKLFQYAKDKLTDIADKGQPFNFTMLTVDTHHMEGYICRLCDNVYPEQYANVIACADRQTADFIRWVQEQSWYKDTVIVLAGDHVSMNNTFWQDIPENYQRRTYNCFVNTGKEKEAVKLKNRKAYSMDLFPTTLAALDVQIEGERLGLGTNLFSDQKTLAEKIDNFEQESLRYSNYYYQHFIK